MILRALVITQAMLSLADEDRLHNAGTQAISPTVSGMTPADEQLLSSLLRPASGSGESLVHTVVNGTLIASLVTPGPTMTNTNEADMGSKWADAITSTTLGKPSTMAPISTSLTTFSCSLDLVPALGGGTYTNWWCDESTSSMYESTSAAKITATPSFVFSTSDRPTSTSSNAGPYSQCAVAQVLEGTILSIWPCKTSVTTTTTVSWAYAGPPLPTSWTARFSPSAQSSAPGPVGDGTACTDFQPEETCAETLEFCTSMTPHSGPGHSTLNLGGHPIASDNRGPLHPTQPAYEISNISVSVLGPGSLTGGWPADDASPSSSDLCTESVSTELSDAGNAYDSFSTISHAVSVIPRTACDVRSDICDTITRFPIPSIAALAQSGSHVFTTTPGISDAARFDLPILSARKDVLNEGELDTRDSRCASICDPYWHHCKAAKCFGSGKLDSKTPSELPNCYQSCVTETCTHAAVANACGLLCGYKGRCTPGPLPYVPHLEGLKEIAAYPLPLPAWPDDSQTTFKTHARRLAGSRDAADTSTSAAGDIENAFDSDQTSPSDQSSKQYDNVKAVAAKRPFSGRLSFLSAALTQGSSIQASSKLAADTLPAEPNAAVLTTMDSGQQVMNIVALTTLYLHPGSDPDTGN